MSHDHIGSSGSCLVVPVLEDDTSITINGCEQDPVCISALLSRVITEKRSDFDMISRM